MRLLETLLLALALGCDAFAVGLGVGTRFCSPRQVFRLSFHFGLFQFMMPLIGWFLGNNLVGVASRWGPWVAFAILLVVGGKMLYEGVRPGEKDAAAECADPTRGVRLVGLSLATSMDALGIGFGLALIGQGLFTAATIIGIMAASMTYVAMKLGNTLSHRFGSRMEALGGIILLGIAIKLVVD